MKRETDRGILRFILLALFLVAGGCGGGGGSSGPGGPVFTSLSQANGIWTLGGTFSFRCNNVPQNQFLSAIKIYVLNGQFSAPVINLSTPVCGISSIKFEGAIALSGEIQGNFATIGGGSILTDVFSGTCDTVSCSGATTGSSLFTFTLTNTKQNVIDGATWYIYIRCIGATPGMYGTNIGFPYTIPIQNGTFSVSNIFTNWYCDTGGAVHVTTAGNASLAGSVNANGDLTATLTQIGGPAITLSGTFTSPTAATITGTSGGIGATAGVTTTWAR